MVVGVIWGMRRHYARVDARMTMKQLRIGMINLKQNNNYDPMSPIGVWTSGQTVKNTTSFKDLNRDFGALCAGRARSFAEVEATPASCAGPAPPISPLRATPMSLRPTRTR